MTHSTGQKLRGLITASLVAWLGSFCLMFLVPQLEYMLVSPLLGREYNWDIHPQTFMSWVSISIVIGLPLAVIVTFVLGFPLWKITERGRQLGYTKALMMGSIAGAIIGFVPTVVLQLITLLSTSVNDNFSSGTWTYGYRLSRDGLLTSLGWALAAKNAFYTVMLGGLTGIVARCIAGPPQRGGEA